MFQLNTQATFFMKIDVTNDYMAMLFFCALLQGEGVAYRGRLLVELESKLGEEIGKELEVMKPPEVIHVQVITIMMGRNTDFIKTILMSTIFLLSRYRVINLPFAAKLSLIYFS